MFKTKKNAFTLAEILLTLIIVGIVSGLVLPGLLKDMTAKSRMSLLKSTLIGIEDSVHKEIAQKRTESIENLDIFINPGDFLATFNNVGVDGAFSDSYNNYNGNAAADFEVPESSILLKSGVGLGIVSRPEDRVSNIVIDVTGANPPNVIGVDLFVAQLYWDEDINNGIHVGDIHGIVSGGPAEYANAALKNMCVGGDATACYRLAELTSFDPKFLENEY